MSSTRAVLGESAAAGRTDGVHAVTMTASVLCFAPPGLRFVGDIAVRAVALADDERVDGADGRCRPALVFGGRPS